MKTLASVTRILVIFGVCVFSSLAFSITTPESKTENGQQGILDTTGAALEVNSFSNQNGVWKPVGEHEIDATVLDLTYKTLTGEFIGAAMAHY